MNEVESELKYLREAGLCRSLSLAKGVDFSSNDYLGLAHSPSIRDRLLSFMKDNGLLGSTGSRLITGENDLTRETEEFIARSFETESALLFGSGYLANLGVLTALSGTSTTGNGTETEFFSDEYNHASLIDGMRLARGQINIFAHNDMQKLEQKLVVSRGRRKVVVTESVFSMDGDSPDLQSLVRLCQKYEAFLVVDEAHATGVHGPSGLGMMKNISCDIESTIIIHTCGKALGSYGAFVTCSRNIRALLINKARSFIYSTALPPILTAQIRFALEESIPANDLRVKLHRNIQMLAGSFHAYGQTWMGSHIGYVEVTGNENVVRAADYLEKSGLHVRPIRFPSVPKGKERLRITVKAFHSRSDIENLSRAIAEILS